MLIAGEPGIGKSRLAEQAGELAAGLGMRRCWARAIDDEGCPPYWMFRQVIRALGPDAEELLGDGPATGAPVLPSGEERFQFFEAITDLLTEVSRPGGLMVVLDDIQWADPSSLRLLVHLAGGLTDSRVLLIATYRDTETGQRAALKHALGDLAREASVSRIRLVGLTEAQLAEHLESLTGAAVPAAVAALVNRRTQGNPFFATELGRLLERAGSPNELERALPDGVRDAVRGRIARLRPLTQRVVATAALLGTGFDPAALAYATDLDLGEVVAALDEAVAAGIVDGTDGWRFSHDIVREVARLELGTSMRLTAHQRLAEYLERQAGADSRPAEIAHHWSRSLPVGDASRAAHWAERAAQAAMEQLAWEEAATLYGQALGAQCDRHSRCALLLGQATALVRAYDIAGAHDATLAAATIARDLGDVQSLARAALTMEGINDPNWVSAAKALTEEALAHFPEDGSPLRTRLLAQLAAHCSVINQFDRADSLSDAALRAARRNGDHAALFTAMRARQMARAFPGGVEERRGLGDELLALGSADGDDHVMLWGRL